MSGVVYRNHTLCRLLSEKFLHTVKNWLWCNGLWAVSFNVWILLACGACNLVRSQGPLLYFDLLDSQLHHA